MKTNLGLTNPPRTNLTSFDSASYAESVPVVFRSSFNHFEKINATQAWSLLFTGGKEDRVFGASPLIGRFYNLGLIAITLLGIFWNVLFQPF